MENRGSVTLQSGVKKRGGTEDGMSRKKRRKNKTKKRPGKRGPSLQTFENTRGPGGKNVMVVSKRSQVAARKACCRQEVGDNKILHTCDKGVKSHAEGTGKILRKGRVTKNWGKIPMGY